MGKEKEVDDLSQPTNESAALQSFKAKIATTLANIQDVDEFRESDKMIDFVFETGRKLFDTPLDQQDIPLMLRTGGKLTGVYVYFGQKSARARAERDVYSQKASEVEKERLLQLLHAGTKVTEARAAVAGEVQELTDLVLEKDVAKNQWENITDATEKMVSFIQSAIRVKENERYHSSRAQHNA
jgi:hypothetical protein